MPSVLIVEDDVFLGRSIEAYLSRMGFEVDAVASTFAALDRLDSRKYSAVVTDIAMPAGMPNGLSLARMVRVRDPRCRVVFITGYAGLAREGDLFGARVFEKPVDLDALAAHINELTASEQRGGG